MRAQASHLLDTLKSVQLTGRQQDGEVEVFHLRWRGNNGLDYATLDDALAAEWIEVTEFTETGEVPRIKIINHSAHMVFMMAGEQLMGCKQNRVVNASIMVPPRSEVPLPVTCVERGRWGYSSSGFSSAHTSSHYKLRAMMVGRLHGAMGKWCASHGSGGCLAGGVPKAKNDGFEFRLGCTTGRVPQLPEETG